MTLKFNNEAIKKHKSKFVNKKNPVLTSFKLDRHTKYKGLYLREYYNGEKHFVVKFRLRGDRLKGDKVFPIGRFDPTIKQTIQTQTTSKVKETNEIFFGTKECEERLFSIVKEHCDDFGRWLKNPNDTVRFTKVKDSKTINEVIEAYCKKGFPKIGKEEKYNGNGIRQRALKLIGYNKRVKFLEYDDDEIGDGYVRFRPYRKERKPAPKDWDELFANYPPGQNILTEEHENKHGVVSIYDSKLGKLKIEELTGQIIINYRKDFETFYEKYAIKELFRTLWRFAISEGYIDSTIKPDPTRDIQELKPRKKPYKYKLKVFSPTVLKLLLDTAESLSPRFPFQSEGVILMGLTGLRREEAFKLLKDDLQWKHEITHTAEGKKVETFGKIILRSAITKMDRDEEIDITEPIKNTLKNILDMGTKTPHNGYNYDLSYYDALPWLFGTTEVRVDKLFDKDYRNSKKTRLKTDKGVWIAIKKEMRQKLGIKDEEEFLCTSKMLRKTYTHECKKALQGRSDLVKRHTRHINETILEEAYDGAPKGEIRDNAYTIGEKLIQFAPKRRTA